MRTKAFLYIAIFLVTFVPLASPGFTQCFSYGTLGEAYFEFDRLARLAVHFGGPADIPGDILCSTSLDPSAERIEFPIYAYNLHEGVTTFEFAIKSNDSIALFRPAGCFSIVSFCRCVCDGYYRYDLTVQSCHPECGPVLIGTAVIERVTMANPVWVDLVPNGVTNRMIVLDAQGRSHSAFAPHHGGYAGLGYLYACQQPICPEPNAAVTNLSAEMSIGCVVKLTWTAGGGNRTIIRYRYDRYPDSFDDGELAVEVLSSPGTFMNYLQPGVPDNQMIYYKAFSVTRDASKTIVLNSFVECGATAEILTNCEIAVRPTTWGRIKELYR